MVWAKARVRLVRKDPVFIRPRLLLKVKLACTGQGVLLGTK